MGFVKKTWSDRMVEFPGRRRLKDVATGDEKIVDVTRNEGDVFREGDAFSKDNMDDMEQRVFDAFSEVDMYLGQLFKIQATSYTYTFNANGSGTFYAPLPSMAGYTPVAIAGYDTNDFHVFFMSIRVESNRVFAGFKNMNNTAATRTATFNVLYLRN